MKIRTVLIYLLFSFYSLSAHPHVFIDMGVRINFEKNSLSGFLVSWKFDEIFSSGVILGYDKNKDGQFSEQENQIVKKEYFDNLINFGYFISYSLNNGKQKRVEEIQDFSAKISGKQVIYSFFVPLSVKAVSSWQKLVISPMDFTFYSSICFNPELGLKLDGSLFSGKLESALELMKSVPYDKNNHPPFLDPVTGKEYGMPVFFDPLTKKEVKPRIALIRFKK